MKRKYECRITGNDQFLVILVIEASNIELALAEGLRQMDAYQNQTIEQCRIYSIEEQFKP